MEGWLRTAWLATESYGEAPGGDAIRMYASSSAQSSQRSVMNTEETYVPMPYATVETWIAAAGCC